MSLEFKPIATAPSDVNGRSQILCRFWYPYLSGHWVYFVAQPAGEKTTAPGYAAPEEWAPLPDDGPPTVD